MVASLTSDSIFYSILLYVSDCTVFSLVVPSGPQVSSQDPGRAPLLLSAECQRSGTVTRVSLDYHCCPATAPSTQLSAVQVLLPLESGDTDLQCQPPATW